MKIDCLSRERHHQEHARAVFDALDPQFRGEFYNNLDSFKQSENEVVLCTSYGDLYHIGLAGKKAIFMEHGVGLFYNNVHPSYAGSKHHREHVILRLSPNERHAARERETLSCPVEVVGVPKMDQWAGKEFKMPRRTQATVAVSFHFDTQVCPETRSAWKSYVNFLPDLHREFKVIGHAHPRMFSKMEPIYRRLGIKPVAEFRDVLKQADIYACDNSSTIFEFAFTGKPVMLLNCAYYRRNISHAGNPRFWEYADIGFNAERGSDLARGALWTYKNWQANAQRQKEIVQNMFSFTDGKCAQRSVEAIYKHVTGLPILRG